MSIIYTSLIRLPLPINSVKEALEQIYKFVGKPQELKNVKSEIHYIDSHHINIIRKFDTVSEYQDWIFSDARNKADEVLMQNGFYLYTKQAHESR